MRKSASEVIRNLESRIARLERQAHQPWSWKETRIAIRSLARSASFPKISHWYEFKVRGAERDQQIGEWWRKKHMYGALLTIIIKVEELPNGMTRFNFIEEGSLISYSPEIFYSSDWLITDAESALKAFHKASIQMSKIAEKKLEDGTFQFR